MTRDILKNKIIEAVELVEQEHDKKVYIALDSNNYRYIIIVLNILNKPVIMASDNKMDFEIMGIWDSNEYIQKILLGDIEIYLQKIEDDITLDECEVTLVL